MNNDEQIKTQVRDKYAQIADQSRADNAASCCGATGSCGPSETTQPDVSDYTVFAEDYSRLSGYDAGADLALGCGLPTEHAHLKPGDTVVDLGAGAGNDCFVARAVVGDTGRVVGVDMTERMIEKARTNAARLGYTNVEFVLGEIETLPLPDATADVVVSNCVLNLVPNKARAFAETFRVLRPGGHFSISDVVLRGHLPVELQRGAELYAGCVAGAIPKGEYLRIITETGFQNVLVQQEREIHLPDKLLRKYLTEAEVTAFHTSDVGIFSVTVYAERP